MLEKRRVLIVDDERLARVRIARMLGELGYPFELAEADSGVAALEMIVSHQPEIVFLDIQMPGLSGLEVLQQLENRPFRVIFQTAYDEFAIQAFEENACDYLLKPFTRVRLQKAVNRALGQIEETQKLAEVEASLRKRDGYLSKISVRQSGKIKIVEVANIDCFVSRDHYTCVHVGGAEHIVELSLAHLEERLDPKVFMRVHRNSIARLDRVRALGRGETMTLEMPSGMLLEVSRSRRAEVREALTRESLMGSIK